MARRRDHGAMDPAHKRSTGTARLLWLAGCALCLLFWAAVLYLLVFR